MPVESIQVQVTKEDCLKGVPRKGNSCPIALALKRQTGEPWYVGGTIACQAGLPAEVDEFFWYELPVEASGFIAMFDAAGGRFVSPFAFTMTRVKREKVVKKE